MLPELCKPAQFWAQVLGCLTRRPSPGFFLPIIGEAENGKKLLRRPTQETTRQSSATICRDKPASKIISWLLTAAPRTPLKKLEVKLTPITDLLFICPSVLASLIHKRHFLEQNNDLLDEKKVEIKLTSVSDSAFSLCPCVLSSPYWR